MKDLVNCLQLCRACNRKSRLHKAKETPTLEWEDRQRRSRELEEQGRERKAAMVPHEVRLHMQSSR